MLDTFILLSVGEGLCALVTKQEPLGLVMVDVYR